MTIEAYMSVDETEDSEILEDITNKGYKNLADKLAITRAEQSIIDDVVGVDGDDETCEEEEDELQSERELKTLFESLYEIDPETKEVFVKGSAYDLKKWDEDMLCFSFGSKDKVISLEESISPSEKYLSKAFDRITETNDKLKDVIGSHMPSLENGEVSRGFISDFTKVLPVSQSNIRVESFTEKPSRTNYTLAMEEVTGTQAALMAGGALVGVTLVYKMLKWFSKMLNKNGEASETIAGNISSYLSTRETLANRDFNSEAAKKTLRESLSGLTEEINQLKRNESSDGGVTALQINAINTLKEMVEGSGDLTAQGTFDAFMTINFVRGYKFTKLTNVILSGALDDAWWNHLKKLSSEAITAQGAISSNIKKITSSDAGKPEIQEIDFKFLSTLDAIVKPLGIDTGANGFKSYASGGWEDTCNSLGAQFNIIASGITVDDVNDKEVKIDVQGLSIINPEIFSVFSDNYVNNLTDTAKSLEELINKATDTDQSNLNINKGDLAEKRKILNTLVRQFKAISIVLRSVVRVRNELGKISVELQASKEKSLSRIEKLAIDAKGKINKAANVASGVRDIISD